MRLVDSIIGVSGILDDTGRVFAFSRHNAPEVC